MRFKGLDLNLIVALDVLLEERSVSRAATRMHVSQPAMSAALGRLRDYFHDPILVVHGKKMIPTAHAMLLRPMIQTMLADAALIISTSAQFDPATTQRTFRICASDYMATVLFPQIIRQLRKDAPRISLEFVQPSESQLTMLDQGEVDIVISIEEYISHEHPAELLFHERHVIAGWSENPLLASPLSADDFYRSGHVAVGIGRHRPTSFAERELGSIGRDRRIELLASSFLVVPEMLVGTDLLAVMHERLASAFSRRIEIRYCNLPFEFPVMSEMIQVHRTQTGDPGLRWLVDCIKRSASDQKT
jgi:LysR family nod box-dependent transcriptional activator